MRRSWPQLIAAAVFLFAWTQLSALAPIQQSGILPIDPPTPYTRYLPHTNALGRVLVVHGLDANRGLMTLFSAALADGGFELYVIDLPGHGESKAEFTTDSAEKAVQNTVAYLGKDTVVIGHSLGAGILLDLATSQHFSSMVLLAPPPVPIDQIRADRVLIATGSIDLPRIRDFVPIAADLAGSHVDTWILPLAAHTTPVFHPGYIKRVVDWLGGDGRRTRTVSRIGWIAVMFVAGLLFGATIYSAPRRRGEDARSIKSREASSVRADGVARSASPIGRSRKQGSAPMQIDAELTAPSAPSAQTPLLCEEGNKPAHVLLVQYVVACAATVLLLKFVNPLAPIHLFGTDYLLGFVFVAGLFLTIAGMYQRRDAVRLEPTALLLAISAAAYVIVVPGLLVLSHVMHMSLSGGRWWRFPVILAAGLPLFVFDEVAIRNIKPQWKSAAIALLTRALLLAAMLTGVLILNRESSFLVLIAPPVTLFWIGLWFAGAIIYKKTGDPLSTALFSAIVQAWVFAAWFVTT